MSAPDGYQTGDFYPYLQSPPPVFGPNGTLPAPFDTRFAGHSMDDRRTFALERIADVVERCANSRIGRWLLR